MGERTTGPIVLVHGAWVGEWCWEPVVPLLEAAARPAYAVSLTGHGTRRDESGPHVTLDDHVRDVVDVVQRHRLDNITLVGHSYGGRVITKSFPEVGSTIARMIYLDAHAPLGPGDGTNGAVPYPVDGQGMVPLAGFAPDPEIFGNDVDAAAGFYDRLAPQSARTLTAPFRVELPAALDKTYVLATAEPSTQFRQYAEAARRDPRWRYLEVPATHWLMYTHPREVAAIILDPATA